MKRSTICGTSKADVLLALAQETEKSALDLHAEVPKTSLANIYVAVRQLQKAKLIFVAALRTQPAAATFRLTPLGELVVDALEVLELLTKHMEASDAGGRLISRAHLRQRKLVEEIARGIP